MKVWLAKVRSVTGNAWHGVGRMEEGKPVDVQRFASPVKLRIEYAEKDRAYFLYRLSADGKGLGDTWSLTLEEAKDQAKFEFEVEEEDWVEFEEKVRPIF